MFVLLHSLQAYFSCLHIAQFCCCIYVVSCGVITLFVYVNAQFPPVVSVLGVCPTIVFVRIRPFLWTLAIE